jgi:hypothetical protein
MDRFFLASINHFLLVLHRKTPQCPRVVVVDLEDDKHGRKVVESPMEAVSRWEPLPYLPYSSAVLDT